MKELMSREMVNMNEIFLNVLSQHIETMIRRNIQGVVATRDRRGALLCRFLW
jgi:hypothetical protein